ncbi:hypothetical protein ACH4JS_12170 [Streptomyces sp. NPDC017638]|uniref:hypothetical protein n=1 Tax=Streptomyces sp. NPDC017638 TaxID=3365004 RepID=UPI0037AEA95E
MTHTTTETAWPGKISAITLFVQDLEATKPNGPMDRPWGIRTASFEDPGGHIWEIAQ